MKENAVRENQLLYYPSRTNGRSKEVRKNAWFVSFISYTRGKIDLKEWAFQLLGLGKPLNGSRDVSHVFGKTRDSCLYLGSGGGT